MSEWVSAGVRMLEYIMLQSLQSVKVVVAVTGRVIQPLLDRIQRVKANILRGGMKICCAEEQK